MILAGIDIGTNTIRVLVADISDQGYQELYSGRTITRLGQDLDRTGLLAAESRERSLQALESFSEEISRHPGCRIAAIGTSALRNARNSAEFVAAVRERTGLTITVISGDEEARLTLKGVLRAFPREKRTRQDLFASALVIDIGGGSTELIVTINGRMEAAASSPLGAVYLTERFLRHDPPDQSELEQLRKEVLLQLDGWEVDLLRSKTVRPGEIPVLIGTAGTITTLAAMDQQLGEYDPAMINGHVLTRLSLDRMIERLSSMPVKDRRLLPGLEHGREDIILAGGLVVQELMERCARQEMIVSDGGLREGIVHDLYERSVER